MWNFFDYSSIISTTIHDHQELFVLKNSAARRADKLGSIFKVILK